MSEQKLSFSRRPGILRDDRRGSYTPDVRDADAEIRHSSMLGRSETRMTWHTPTRTPPPDDSEL